MIKKKSVLLSLISCLLISCNGVTYNKVFLSDDDMKLGSKTTQKAEISSASYREGAAGAEGIDSGGGCGCN